jgi:hypothetical protein
MCGLPSARSVLILQSGLVAGHSPRAARGHGTCSVFGSGRRWYRRRAREAGVVRRNAQDERFERIEGRLDTLIAGQAELRADVAVLKADVVVLKADVAGLKADVVGLKADVVGLKADVGDLRRHMGVLHEDVIARIGAIPDPTEPLMRAMRAEFAQLREEMDRRFVPLEATVRQHSIDIELLKQQRG